MFNLPYRAEQLRFQFGFAGACQCTAMIYDMLRSTGQLKFDLSAVGKHAPFGTEWRSCISVILGACHILLRHKYTGIAGLRDETRMFKFLRAPRSSTPRFLAILIDDS